MINIKDGLNDYWTRLNNSQDEYALFPVRLYHIKPVHFYEKYQDNKTRAKSFGDEGKQGLVWLRAWSPRYLWRERCCVWEDIERRGGARGIRFVYWGGSSYRDLQYKVGATGLVPVRYRWGTPVCVRCAWLNEPQYCNLEQKWDRWKPPVAAP